MNTLESAVIDYDTGLRDNPTISSYYLEDADFLRMDNFSIGQRLAVNSKTFKNLKIYLTMTNLFTLTEYTGTDPELSYGGFEFGRDQYDVYPKTRSINTRLECCFLIHISYEEDTYPQHNNPYGDFLAPSLKKRFMTRSQKADFLKMRVRLHSWSYQLTMN